MNADLEKMKKLETMTMKEFMAWLDGYSENFNSAPNEEQWKRVLEKLKRVQTSNYLVNPAYYSNPFKDSRYTGAIPTGVS